MLFFQSVALLSFAAGVFSRSLPKPHKVRQAPTTTGPAAPNPTICGDIVEAVDDPENFIVFWAQDAYDCLRSVPFNPAVASRFIKYWNETIQFQSTLAYLKNPPQGYQQPSVDVLSELAKIQQRIDSGFYTNEYVFEADFQLLEYSIKDAHVSLSAGALAAFSFASPFEIVSVSIDGKQAPKVYVTQDILDSQTQGWTPSAIKTINGDDATDFLTKYAALNSYGYVEPHAEWNALMSNPALDIQGGLTTFSGGGTFYPGANLSVTFENATNPIDTIWVAIWNEPANYTGPLTTGGDFYNYFVLGEVPASFNESLIVAPTFDLTSEPLSNWTDASFGAFPDDPDVAQPELGILQGGIVTGYFYEEISTGVLSLPTFDIVPATIPNYTQTVVEFIGNASNANISKVIIDLQRNPGGQTLLPYTIFKLFFPDVVPFGGSRRRVFSQANALGTTFTDYWNDLDESDDDQLTFKQEIAASEWVISDRLNAATGKNFTNWQEYAGPVNDNGDTFSLTEQYDLSNVVFDEAAFDQYYPTMYLPNKTAWPLTQQVWNADQIVLLTDGLCSSACALFVEFMTRQGVKTITAGGRPTTGPIQAASGNRGAAIYDSFSIDDDISFARSIDQYEPQDNANGTLPDVRETGIFINFASFNLRDQVRKNDNTPLQFKYEAADCRIYYTLANVYNFTRLWHDVAAAAWTDSSLCVDGSTGYSTTNNTAPSKSPPAPTAQKPTLNINQPIVEQVEFEEEPTGGLQDAVGRPRGGNGFELCGAGGTCAGTSICKQITIDCSGTPKPASVCLPQCSNQKGSSSCPGVCNILSTKENKAGGLNSNVKTQSNLFTGLCFPTVGNKKLGCPSNPR